MHILVVRAAKPPCRQADHRHHALGHAAKWMGLLTNDSCHIPCLTPPYCHTSSRARLEASTFARAPGPRQRASNCRHCGGLTSPTWDIRECSEPRQLVSMDPRCALTSVDTRVCLSIQPTLSFGADRDAACDVPRRRWQWQCVERIRNICAAVTPARRGDTR